MVLVAGPLKPLRRYYGNFHLYNFHYRIDEDSQGTLLLRLVVITVVSKHSFFYQKCGGPHSEYNSISLHDKYL